MASGRQPRWRWIHAARDRSNTGGVFQTAGRDAASASSQRLAFASDSARRSQAGSQRGFRATALSKAAKHSCRSSGPLSISANRSQERASPPRRWLRSRASATASSGFFSWADHSRIARQGQSYPGWSKIARCAWSMAVSFSPRCQSTSAREPWLSAFSGSRATAFCRISAARLSWPSR